MAEEKPKTDEAVTSEEKSEAQVVDAPVEAPKKRFGFKLPFTGGKKEEVESQLPVEPPAKPISPEELVNDLDKDIAIHAQTKQARLEAVMSGEIKNVTENKITVSIRARKLLLMSGIVVITTWVVVLGSIVFEQARARGVDFSTILSQFQRPPETPAPVDRLSQVRIRDGTSGSDEVKQIAEFLETEMGFAYVEIVADDQIEDEVMTVYAQVEAYQQLLQVIDRLGESYPVASGSAQISSDSDFGVVIAFPAVE